MLFVNRIVVEFQFDHITGTDLQQILFDPVTELRRQVNIQFGNVGCRFFRLSNVVMSAAAFDFVANNQIDESVVAGVVECQALTALFVGRRFL